MLITKVIGTVIIASIIITGFGKAASANETQNIEITADTEIRTSYEFNPHVYSPTIAQEIPQDYWDSFYNLCDALRNGEMTRISLTQVNGLITFPSFHAALAIILIYASRGVKVLFPAFLVLNLLMLAATPTVGGHYFIDIIAGACVVLCLACLRQLRWGTLLARWNAAPSHAAG